MIRQPRVLAPQAPVQFTGVEKQHVSRTPMDKMIPKGLVNEYPEAKLYQDLQEAEKRLDALLSRKRFDLRDMLARHFKQTQILRVFISNTAHDQPWQNLSKLEEPFDLELATWNLRIEGRLVQDEALNTDSRKPFSSYFTSIIVELEASSEDEAPTLAADGTTLESNIIEWHEAAPNSGSHSAEFDVLDIRRKGERNRRVKIQLQLKEAPTKLKLSPQLADILAIQEGTRAGVIVAMWQYVKFHKLQDQDERRLIRCDGPLKSLFRADTVSFPHMIGLLSPHLKPRDPIVIDYEIRTDKENTLGEVAYDIEVDVRDPQVEVLAQILEKWSDNHTDINALDEQIGAVTQALKTTQLRKEFFSDLAANPTEFVNKWTDMQARDLKFIMGDKVFNEESVRDSSFYTDELLNQSLHLFLNTRR